MEEEAFKQAIGSVPLWADATKKVEGWERESAAVEARATVAAAHVDRRPIARRHEARVSLGVLDHHALIDRAGGRTERHQCREPAAALREMHAFLSRGE